MSRNTVVIVVACAQDNAIGLNNSMPWGKFKHDMGRFVRLTKGHPVIMGRKTFQSIGQMPLPERENIVLTRKPETMPDAVKTYGNLHSCTSLDDALSLAGGFATGKTCIIGGAEIYRQAMPFADCIHLTRIGACYGADTFLPEIEADMWSESDKESVVENGTTLEFVNLMRTATEINLQQEKEMALQSLLKLNNNHEIQLARLDMATFLNLIGKSYSAVKIAPNDALLVSFNEQSDYSSPNFKWFKERFERFTYVDRVVVSPRLRGRGYGRRLYEDLMAKACTDGRSLIACEINVVPPNPESMAFHQSMGFKETGTGKVGGRTVTYMIRDTDSKG